MANPVVGLRGRMTSRRADESPRAYQETKGEPSRRVEVQTSLHILEVAYQPAVDGQADLLAFLEFSEEVVGNSGTEAQESGNSTITLRIPIQAKEVALLTGLIGRRVSLRGEVPEKHWSYEQLQEAFFRLKGEYEDLVYRLEEATNLREGLTTVRQLA